MQPVENKGNIVLLKRNLTPDKLDLSIVLDIEQMGICPMNRTIKAGIICSTLRTIQTV